MGGWRAASVQHQVQQNNCRHRSSCAQMLRNRCAHRAWCCSLQQQLLPLARESCVFAICLFSWLANAYVPNSLGKERLGERRGEACECDCLWHRHMTCRSTSLGYTGVFIQKYMPLEAHMAAAHPPSSTIYNTLQTCSQMHVQESRTRFLHATECVN